MVSLAAPLDEWDKDPAHLRDHQVAQIFFNVIICEVFILAILAPSEEETDGGGLKVLTIIIKGLTAAAGCLVMALL